MQQQVFKNILGRFKRTDYKYLYEKWPPLSWGSPLKNVIDLEKVTKIAFVDTVLKKFKNNITPALITSLDLVFLQKYPNRKLWKVYKVVKNDGKKVTKSLGVEQFWKKLKREIKLYQDAVVGVSEHHGAYWVRVSTEGSQGKKTTPPPPTYIVHVPNTDYIFITGLRVSQRQIIMQSLLTVLEGHDMSDIHLSGHHLVSLLTMVLHNNTQGEDIELPGMIERSMEEEDLPENVYNENHGEKRTRDKFVRDTFGPCKQPKLEKIEYKLETKFKGDQYVPKMAEDDEVFHCRVKFEGPDVLEGLRNLAEAGLAEIPMKTHVGKVHKMARNMFCLKQN